MNKSTARLQKIEQDNRLEPLIKDNFDSVQAECIENFLQNISTHTLEYKSENEKLLQIVFYYLEMFFYLGGHYEELIVLYRNFLEVDIETLDKNLYLHFKLGSSLTTLYTLRKKVDGAWPLIREYCKLQISIEKDAAKIFLSDIDDLNKTKHEYLLEDIPLTLPFHQGYETYVKWLFEDGQYTEMFAVISEGCQKGWLRSNTFKKYDKYKNKVDVNAHPYKDFNFKESCKSRLLRDSKIPYLSRDWPTDTVGLSKKQKDYYLNLKFKLINDDHNYLEEHSVFDDAYLALFLCEILRDNRDAILLYNKLQLILPKIPTSGIIYYYVLDAALDCLIIMQDFESFMKKTSLKHGGKKVHQRHCTLRVSVTLHLNLDIEIDDILNYLRTPTSVYYKRNKDLFVEILRTAISSDKEIIATIRKVFKSKCRTKYELNGFNFNYVDFNETHKSNIKTMDCFDTYFKNEITSKLSVLVAATIQQLKEQKK
jgi:hypothetical protein